MNVCIYFDTYLYDTSMYDDVDDVDDFPFLPSK